MYPHPELTPEQKQDVPEMGSDGGRCLELTYLQSGLAAILVHSKSLLLGGQCAAQ